ncbi:MAG: hypothetical protein ABIR71_00160 [Chthoniobacterales bacterium]
MNLFLRKLRGVFLALVAVGVCDALAQAPDAIARATAEYQAGNFREAVAHYQSAIDAGTRNAALFYNLGNASYRAGDSAGAILNYERALLLQAHHPEARANLHLVQDKARALQLRSTWWEGILARATPNQFSIALAVSFWLAAFCFAAWGLAARRSPVLFLVAVLALLASGIAVGVLYALETGRHGQAFAIVTGEKVQARVATADNAGSVLVLPPGSEVRILSTRGDWIYAALPNDLRGWIPAESVQRVRL